MPMLLSKSRQAGWRVAVRGTTVERMQWLDDKLWLGPEDGFLPHGLAGGEFDVEQPILLTTSTEMPNAATCLMLIDGAEVSSDEVTALDRVCVLFDGNEPAAVEAARGQWKALTEAGCAAQYWSQESGSWAMKAVSTGQN